MLVFFTFMTQMHERHCTAAVVILVLLVVEPRSRWLWVALSIVFTLNLLAAVPPTAQIEGVLPVSGPLGSWGLRDDRDDPCRTGGCDGRPRPADGCRRLRRLDPSRASPRTVRLRRPRGRSVRLVYLGLGMTFFADEWAFIESRALADPGTWWAPHNEHWTTLAILVYRALVETVGIGSYVPYLVVVALLHVAVSALCYLLLERSSGPLFALAGSAIVLVFGSGFENLIGASRSASSARWHWGSPPWW